MTVNRFEISPINAPLAQLCYSGGISANFAASSVTSDHYTELTDTTVIRIPKIYEY